jgi:hypothetical protein
MGSSEPGSARLMVDRFDRERALLTDPHHNEQGLSSTAAFLVDHQAKVEEKPSIRKAGDRRPAARARDKRLPPL